MAFIGFYLLLDMLFYSTYARKFKIVSNSFEDSSSNLKDRKVYADFNSTFFWLENTDGNFKLSNYYIYLLSHVLLQLGFFLTLVLYLDYNIEDVNTMREKFSTYFSRSIDKTFPSSARCDFSTCTHGGSVRVEQLMCQLQINVHYKFIIPSLIFTTLFTCLYGIGYIIYFIIAFYDGKCKKDRNCSDCRLHRLHCSQKFKLLKYIKYPIFKMNSKVDQAMLHLDINDILCLVIISRDLKPYDFCLFFENYLQKTSTGPSSLKSLIPDVPES